MIDIYQNPNRAWQEMVVPSERASQQVSRYSDDRQQLFESINAERAKMRIQPLKRSGILDVSSNQKIIDQMQYNQRGHESPSGKTTADWFKLVGYKGNLRGENLAMGSQDFIPEDNLAVIQSWLNSKAGHKEIMLSSDFSEVGIAKKGKFIAVHFGGNANDDAKKKYKAYMR